MIEVVIRQVNWEEGISLGKFSPNEIENIVDLFKEYGAFSFSNELEAASYYDSSFDLDNKCFEIVLD